MRLPLLATTFLAAPALLAGCTRGETPPPEAVAAQTATVSQAAVGPVAPATAPRPQIGNYGFDEAGMDKSIAPGDDFYGFANGSWARSTPIPADKSNFGMFSVLDDLSKQRTQEILEAAKTDPNSKIGTAYATYLDQAGIDAKGIAPIRPWLDQIKGLKSKAALPALYARADRNGVPVPFGSYVNQDDKNPDVYAFNIVQAGLGMPDRDYYLSKDAELAKTRAAYEGHLARVLTLAGEPNAAARAKAILAFETKVAQAHWTRVDSRDANKTYNKLTVAELAKKAPGFDFRGYLAGVGANVDYVIVAQPSAVSGIARLINTTPVGVLKDQLMVRSLDNFADVLPSSFDKEQFAFYGTTLSGTPEQQVRWKRAVEFTTGAVSDEVSKVYVAKYFPPATKAAADALVKNVIAAMDRRIDQLDWMAADTKVKAHAKLAAFTPKIGYPDQWHDYSNLQIVAGDAYGNNVRANNWAHEDQISKLGSPIRRWEWGMTPMEINAYANFGMVEIVFPAAILQPPFFDPNADPAINYGGIGAVIGHELSHHFDDQGAKYNAEGRLTDWWTPADVTAFKARTDALSAQYDQYEPLPGMHVKGALTLGENVADLAGLTVAYDAYKHALGGEGAPVLDGTSGDQRFYLGWAQVWRRNYREANLRQRLLTDPHSPSEQRAWVVRNLDPWYSAFAPAQGNKLFLTPEQRVRIW
ncbi:putative endopeptidase [Sphingomonas naasensis]|uniref:M13 family peptidase n=1 Tax=Sphingomonas naasensis TaxID=1344951 RepID=A0A4S1WR59_9SPHN|nr:M13 family metallopeptidase [Sphingomonas naasensis]NIJ18603.1 putative endopeptidase [Sphingomonas naasensis]TGX45851.1 M13 family peptidase [Sphingomonas naasensis]